MMQDGNSRSVEVMVVVEEEEEKKKKKKKEEVSSKYAFLRQFLFPRGAYLCLLFHVFFHLTYYGFNFLFRAFMNSRYPANIDVIVYVCLTLQLLAGVFGGVLSDAYLGKYQTIVLFCSVLLLGNIMVYITSTLDYEVPMRSLSVTGIVLVVIAIGGQGAAQFTIDGDQFTLPRDEEQISAYFAFFYMSIELSEVYGVYWIDNMTSGLPCYGPEPCFSTGFLFCTLFVLLGLRILVCFKHWLILREPDPFLLNDIAGCVKAALKERYRARKEERGKPCWLNYASYAYSDQLIDEIKQFITIACIALSFIFFVTTSSAKNFWIWQKGLETKLGSMVLNPDVLAGIYCGFVVVFAFVHVFLYPQFLKSKFTRTCFHRTCLGAIVMSIALILGAILQLFVEASPPLNISEQRIADDFHLFVRATPLANQSRTYLKYAHDTNFSPVPQRQYLRCTSCLNDTTQMGHSVPGLLNSSANMKVAQFDRRVPVKVHKAWTIPLLCLKAMAGVLMHVNIRIFLYTQTPYAMKSLAFVFFMVTIVGSSVVYAFIAHWPLIPPSSRLMVIMVFHSLGLIPCFWLARKYQFKNYESPPVYSY